jgi:hypothetical protein
MTEKSRSLSTTALSKELGISTKELFESLRSDGFIVREGESWVLTRLGEEKGGTVKKHPQHGPYIAWDESIKNELNIDEEGKGKLISAIGLGKHFSISRFRVNPILSELGYLEKNVKGWTATNLGLSNGGKQLEYEQTGIPYVSWDESILTNKRFLESIKQIQGDSVEVVEKDEKIEVPKNIAVGFREKYEATQRTADGHYVRSRAEMLIDNWLYMSEIVHAYERKLPVEEDAYCDFYLPVGKVYIEFWGLENDEKYNERKKIKLGIYRKYGFKLIEIDDSDILNLDDILPKKLLKFGIQAY